jgi:hypothetical protein
MTCPACGAEERRVVTVLLAGLVDSTRPVTALDQLHSLADLAEAPGPAGSGTRGEMGT